MLFTFFLFLRELWHQLLNALFEIQDEEDEAAEAEEMAADMMQHDVAEAGALGRDSSDGGESVQMAWDDGSGEAGAGAVGPTNGGEHHSPQDSPRDGAADGAPAAEEEEGAAEEPQQPQAGQHVQQAHVAGTPPAPSWVSRLASPADKPRE